MNFLEDLSDNSLIFTRDSKFLLLISEHDQVVLNAFGNSAYPKV